MAGADVVSGSEIGDPQLVPSQRLFHTAAGLRPQLDKRKKPLYFRSLTAIQLRMKQCSD
jgi:hypothetical protein